MKYLQKIYTIYFHYLKQQLIAVLLLLSSLNTFPQQVYPVLSNIQVGTPYSSYLSDYAGAGSTKLQVNLFLKDLTKTNYACRLRVKIEGFGITIQSKNDFNVAALMINGGELSVISGSALEPYLNPQNLVFQGMSQAEFSRSGGKLPEGIYRFSVEVLDYYRKNQVSNSGMAVVSIFLAYPPIINQPLHQSKVSPLDPQNVVFQWTPRNAASLNGAYNIAYKFKLAEIIPADRDPNDAIRTSRPLYETYTDQTLLVYGISEPQLTPGNSYAVQVQAIEAEGKDLFVNNGNSEVVKFTYGDKCPFPLNISAELTATDAIKVSWNAQPQQQAFTIRYREAQKTGAQWFEQETYTPDYTIQGLRPSTTYEYQVKSQCIYGYGDYSQSQTFTMPDEDLSKGDFVCGRAEDQTINEQGEPLPNLLPNTIFFAGKFPVTITTANGADGTFSGTGTVGLPFLNFLSFKVAFNNIRINDKLKMTEGKVTFVRQTLDQSIDQAIAANTLTPDENGNVQAKQTALPNIIDAAIQWPGALPTYNQQTNTVKFTSTATADNGTTTTKEITIQLQEGQPPYTFQDKNGETFQVDKDGKVDHLGKIPASQYLAGNNTTSQTINTEKAQVTFAPPATGHKYGFDTYNPTHKANSRYAQDYQNLNDPNNKDQRVSWKSIESGQTDQVTATFTNPDKTLDPGKLEFRTGTGEKLSAALNISTSSTDPTYTINLIGALAGNTKEIYAVYPKGKEQNKDTYLGKLNIASYQKISKKVVIVPVNGAGAELNANQLKDQLNEIYKQAITSWEVELADNFQTDNKYDNLETASSDLLSAYTEGQKALINAYKQQHQLKDNTYYIFVVKALSDQSKGYMVRGGQVGFVATTDSRTIAHELGHGAFMLKHTFEDLGLKKGNTSNLMDYGQTGTELWHSQWQYMRNPDIIFRPFEGDEQGAYAGIAAIDINLNLVNGILEENQNQTVFYRNGYIITFNVSDVNYDDKTNLYTVKIDGKNVNLKLLYSVKGDNQVDYGKIPQLYDVKQLPSETIINGISTYKNAKPFLSGYTIEPIRNQDVIYYYDKLIARKDISIVQRATLTKLIAKLSLENIEKAFCSDKAKEDCECIDVKDLSKDYSKCWDKLITQLQNRDTDAKTLNEELLALVKATRVDKSKVDEKFTLLKTDNYLRFSVEERKLLLGYLVCGYMTSLNSRETYALELIKNVPKTDAAAIIAALETKPIKLNDTRLIADYKDRILLYNLDRKIDGDNYNEFAKAIKNLMLNSADLESRLSQAVADFNNRMFVLGASGGTKQTGTIELSSADWTSGDKISIIKSEFTKEQRDTYIPMGSGEPMLTETREYTIANKLPAINLNPFDLVLLTNFNNNTNILTALDKNADDLDNKTLIVPACFLKYADKKITNEAIVDNTTTAVFIALDVVTIIKGVPAFSTIRTAYLAGEVSKGVMYAKYAYKVFEIGNALGNLTLNAAKSSLRGTTFEKLNNASNLLMLAINAPDIAKGSIKGISVIYGKSKQALVSGLNAIKKQILVKFVAAIIDHEAELYALKNEGKLSAAAAKEIDELLIAKNKIEVEGRSAYGTNEWDEAIRGARGSENVENVVQLENIFFKNADDFTATFDKAGTLNQTIRNHAFDLYKQGKWKELEILFKSNSLNGSWPPANGGYNIVDEVSLKAGQKFDRYSGAIGNYNGQGYPILGGNFTSPISNGKVYSFGQRALNQAENVYDFYYEIEVLKDLPFKGQTADVIPWFNQIGNGKQTMWKIPIDPATGYSKTWNKLAEEGYIKITIKNSPSGKYSNIVGTVIQ